MAGCLQNTVNTNAVIYCCSGFLTGKYHPDLTFLRGLSAGVFCDGERLVDGLCGRFHLCLTMINGKRTNPRNLRMFRPEDTIFLSLPDSHFISLTHSDFGIFFQA